VLGLRTYSGWKQLFTPKRFVAVTHFLFYCSISWGSTILCDSGIVNSWSVIVGRDSPAISMASSIFSFRRAATWR
jgi:hypothetical protein